LTVQRVSFVKIDLNKSKSIFKIKEFRVCWPKKTIGGRGTHDMSGSLATRHPSRKRSPIGVSVSVVSDGVSDGVSGGGGCIAVTEATKCVGETG